MQNDEESKESDGSEASKEMALITRRFIRFLRKKQGLRKRPVIKGELSKEKEKEQSLICYECKKPGHFKMDYPLLKKALKKQRRKAMMATWSDNDESSSEEEQ